MRQIIVTLVGIALVQTTAAQQVFVDEDFNNSTGAPPVTLPYDPDFPITGLFDPGLSQTGYYVYSSTPFSGTAQAPLTAGPDGSPAVVIDVQSFTDPGIAGLDWNTGVVHTDFDAMVTATNPSLLLFTADVKIDAGRVLAVIVNIGIAGSPQNQSLFFTTGTGAFETLTFVLGDHLSLPWTTPTKTGVNIRILNLSDDPDDLAPRTLTVDNLRFEQTAVNPPEILTHPIDRVLLEFGSDTQLACTATGADTYQWLLSDQPLADGPSISGATTPTLTITGADGLDGYYTCLASNAGGDVSSDSALVAVTPNPCPVDLNGDGFLDNGDIGLFITLFLAGC